MNARELNSIKPTCLEHTEPTGAFLSDVTTDSNDQYFMTNPMPHHYEEIQELCKRVYPFSKPWSITQLESHRTYFPDGQLIVIDRETNKIVGLAFSLIVVWADYSHQDNWLDFTSGGYFHNHNPKKGKTLYGAEVIVDPETRGRGIGKMLYKGRWDIVEKYDLKRIRAGARLRGYSKFKEKLTVEEYVKAVIKKELYDPTLSFQLNHGFEVIDVAANYLFNDPESLGFAAVIELVNPKIATARDLEQHIQKVQQFLTADKYIPTNLPKELRRLVRKTTQTLGKIILEEEGEKFYRRVESYREQAKKTRLKKDKKIFVSLLEQLKKENQQDRLKITHGFSLQLAVINVCEAAYRTWRLRQRATSQGVKNKLNLIYVLTAHPTEARSKATVEALDRLERTLIEGIQSGFSFNEEALSSQMRLLWLRSLPKVKKPTVLDEAEYIYSLVFEPHIFDFILSDKSSYELNLRTWVGGDKDGHPGVDAEIMRQCLNLSRNRMVATALSKIEGVLQDLMSLEEIGRVKKSEVQQLKKLGEDLKKMNIITAGDGTRIKGWSMKLKTYVKASPLLISKHHKMILLLRIVELFPALVLPIELRDHADKIKEGLSSKGSAIRGMLAELNKIAGVLDARKYASSLVISNCESSSDLDNACSLVETTVKNRAFPIVPLFESREALMASKKILKSWFAKKKNLDLVRQHWDSKFEVMLGYSDSAKQNGVLASRYLIAGAMNDCGKVLKTHQIRPVFFHGSGGSVARGGGSLKEQIAWWTKPAVENPKLTVQGEMIQRLFSSREILHSQCVHLTNESLRRNIRRSRTEKSAEMDRFVEAVRTEYVSLVENPILLERLLDGTPYRYLDVLQIGSRPAKRPAQGAASPSSLRAIPWVLCWTQSRILMPTWWGVGTAWKNSDPATKEKLTEQFKEGAFLSSFVKALGFSLAKVELNVWELYFDDKNDKDLFKLFRDEYALALHFLQDITGQKELIWYRPWLEESIRLRSSLIHVLNMLQILAMKSDDEALLKETIVGIGCGMLTTG